ncbi:unnamed protein product, partial [marine sediment metagenome]
RGHMVCPGSNPTDTGDNPWHLLYRPSLAESLETPELYHLEVGIVHITFFIQEYVDLSFPFQPGYRVDGNPS